MQIAALYQEKTRPTHFSRTRFLLLEKYCIKLYHALTIAAAQGACAARPFGGDYNHRLNYGIYPSLERQTYALRSYSPKVRFFFSHISLKNLFQHQKDISESLFSYSARDVLSAPNMGREPRKYPFFILNSSFSPVTIEYA